MKRENFKKYLAGIILQDQIKVTCKDKHSYICSKGQGVRGVGLGSEENTADDKEKSSSSAKCCFRTSPKQQQRLKSYSHAAKQKPQARGVGACSIQLENTGLHQIRANKELDKSQQSQSLSKKADVHATHNITTSGRRISRHFSHLKTLLLPPLVGLF